MMFSHEIWLELKIISCYIQTTKKCLSILLVKQLEWISSIPWDRKSKWVLEVHLSGSLKYTCVLEIVCIDSKKQNKKKTQIIWNNFSSSFYFSLHFQTCQKYSFPPEMIKLLFRLTFWGGKWTSFYVLKHNDCTQKLFIRSGMEMEEMNPLLPLLYFTAE